MDYGDKLPPSPQYIFTTPRRYIFTPPLTVRRFADAKGGFDYVLDIDRLAESKLVVPGRPQISRLFSMIRSNQMPDGAALYEFGAGDRPPVPDDEKELVRRWIISLDDRDQNQRLAERPFVTDGEIVQYIVNDLGNLSSTKGKTARYFTLTHLHNYHESDTNLQVYRDGLAKLLNSLSWKRRVVRPVAIDPYETIYRVHLEDLGWTPDQWEKLIEGNPYGVAHETNFYNMVRNFPGTALAFVRADWFVFKASRPPLYHELLALPDTARQLEALLGAEVDLNIRLHQAARAGVTVSGVSRNNRLIERHDSNYGAYWKSYDFASGAGRKNLLAHPLGPGGAAGFQHDGGEITFSLPNHFQGYLLVNARGNRLNDPAPINIVSDRNRPDRPEIINGISCMGCHDNGIQTAVDEIRPYAHESAAFSAEDLESIEGLYPAAAEFDGLLEEDRERFIEALSRAGIDPARRDGQGREPISALADRFERAVDLRQAAAELGLTEEELLEKLNRTRASLETKALLVRKNVPREEFIQLFARLQREFGTGTLLAGTLPIAATKEYGTSEVEAPAPAPKIPSRAAVEAEVAPSEVARDPIDGVWTGTLTWASDHVPGGSCQLTIETAGHVIVPLGFECGRSESGRPGVFRLVGQIDANGNLINAVLSERVRTRRVVLEGTIASFRGYSHHGVFVQGSFRRSADDGWSFLGA